MSGSTRLRRTGHRRTFRSRVTIRPPRCRGYRARRGMMMRALAVGLLAFLSLGLGGCGYNALQAQDENVKAAWSEVVNQYQRRSDLIPNLVNTVKGFAVQEQQVLIGVTEARAKANSIQVTPE